MDKQNSHQSHNENFDSDSVLHKIEQNTFNKLRSLKLMLVFIVLSLLFIGVILYRNVYNNKKTSTLTPSEGEVVRHDNLPEEIKNKKEYREVTIQDEIRLHSRGSIQKIINENTYSIEFDTGEILTININEDTTLGDAWIEVNESEGYTKSSYDIVTREELSGLSEGSRVEVFYNPESISENEVPANLFIIYE